MKQAAGLQKVSLPFLYKKVFQCYSFITWESAAGKVVMFNKNQIEAISHKEGPAIVLAGPGSGKTTVITHRIKNLIECHSVLPEEILVVTFTKTAAIHMKERFLKIMKDSGIHKSCPVTFGTFHSVYYRILRLSGDDNGNEILSDRMKSDMLKEIIIRNRIDVSSLQDFVQSISGEISRFKGNMKRLEVYAPKCCNQEIFERIYTEYEKALKAERRIDFEDILLKCYAILSKNQRVLKEWQEIYQYILIDEFQDINQVQYEIIKMLALPQNNIFIVGDDDQSIYGFRGSRPEIMFQFQKDYPEAVEIRLNINYRSTPEIVELSENLITHNNHRFEKKMISLKKGGVRPDIRQFRNQGEELMYLCNQIKKYMKEGIEPSEMAILVRNNSQISGIVEFLKNEMLEIRNTKRDYSIYQGMVAKDVMAYIKAALLSEIIPLRENKGLIYILNKPARLISRQIIGQEDMNFERLKQMYRHSQEILKNIEQLQFHMTMIKKLNPSAALTYIRNGTGYEKYLQQYAREKKRKLSVLLDQFDKLQKEALRFSTLQEWIEFVETQGMECQDKTDNIEANSNQINIITMHGSKGLEFKVVFIVDVNQGIIPSSRAVRERDFQEERRVFYVAMTRAAEILNIYGVTESLGCQMEISMFVEEIFKNS